MPKFNTQRNNGLKESWDDLCGKLDSVGDAVEELLEAIPDNTKLMKLKRAMVKRWGAVRVATGKTDLFISPVQSVKVDSPWTSDKFLEAWQFWKDYLNEQHGFVIRSRMEVKQLTRLVKLSGNNPAKAMEILDVAMAGGYTNIFELDETKKTKNNNETKNFSLNNYLK